MLGLCVKPDDGGRAVSVIENIVMGKSAVSDRQKEWIGQEKRELQKPEEERTDQGSEEQGAIAVPKMIDINEPTIKWNGKTGELRYDWDYNSVRVDADTLLFVSECYFSEEKLRQKIFFRL